MDTVTRVEIMRSGNVARLAAMTGALLLTGACAQATGVAGISTQPPATPTPSGSPSVTATIPSPTAVHQAGEQKPVGEDPVKVPPPKLSKYTYAFPVKGCKTSYQRRLLILPKTTVWAGKGCAFVSPVDGVVDEVNVQNKWKPSTDKGADREGRFVTVIGDDGVRYLGGHLDTVAVRPGAKVKAGQTLGTIGNSGNARDTASNLYFAISWKTAPAYWWVRRGMVAPWDYLDAWLSGNPTLSPKDATFKLRSAVGETPRCQVQCKSRKPSQPEKNDQPKEEEEDPGPILNG